MRETRASLTSAETPTRGRSNVVDVISALGLLDGTLAAREQKVANYVKANLEAILTMNIADLANETSVSTPTVIRFCRSLGCDGFKDFKLRLAQNLAVSRSYLQTDYLNAPISVDSALDQVLAMVFSALSVVRHGVDARQLDMAKSALMSCHQLVTAGLGGGSSMLAEEAANRFFRLGLPTAAVSDSYLLQMRAASLGQNDILLLFSASGETDAVVAAAKVARGYRATTIGVTRSGSRLAAAVSLPITVNLPEDPDIFKPSASRYAHLTILDTLALSVARGRSELTSENLRRIRASLTAYHGRTDPQPLGD